MWKGPGSPHSDMTTSGPPVFVRNRAEPSDAWLDHQLTASSLGRGGGAGFEP